VLQEVDAHHSEALREAEERHTRALAEALTAERRLRFDVEATLTKAGVRAVGCAHVYALVRAMFLGSVLPGSARCGCCDSDWER